MHNLDGSRTVCTGRDLENCRVVNQKTVLDNWWGNDPRTANPYPPNAPSLVHMRSMEEPAVQAKPAAPATPAPVEGTEPAKVEKKLPYFNSYDGVMHNPDGSRTTCTP